ncbi:MAG: hypothetical protein LUD79_09630 [Oscillospiraceae bacterium]|nr:hypothetical protein [Oscillospiraceae bacterium]
MKRLKAMDGKKLALIAVAVVLVIAAAVFGITRLSHKTVYISGTLEEKTLDDLYEQSALVAVGTVSGKSEAFQIQNVSGGTANFTDYYFDVSTALRGAAESETVTVRVQGGTVGNYTEVCESSPALEVGDEYLLFLYKPGRGGAYNTEGDYYYVLGQAQGCFTADSSESYVSQNGVTLTQESLTAALSDEDLEPVNVDYFREEYIANQQRNLESGFITQEEYDEMMANIDQYATIVS